MDHLDIFDLKGIQIKKTKDSLVEAGKKRQVSVSSEQLGEYVRFIGILLKQLIKLNPT